MAKSTTTSRFQLLLDDAGDPFETVKKSKKKTHTSDGNKTGSNQNNKNNTSKKKSSSAKPSTNSSSADKKEQSTNNSKKKKSTTPPQTVQNSDPVLNKSNFAQGDHAGSKPAGMSNEDWIKWKQRDLDYVSGTYESDLEAAILQSKLEHQQEQNKLQHESQSKIKAKKKPITVPLNEFSAMFNNGNPTVQQPPPLPSTSSPVRSASNGCVSPSFSDDELERLRQDAQMATRRELRLEMDREILQSRNQQVPSAPISYGIDSLEFRHILDEKDRIIAKLSEDKLELERELEMSKTRFRKLWGVVGSANLKEKVYLCAEVDKLTQLNTQLTTEISNVHGQLELERSKSHVLLLKCKQFEEKTRRRTGSTTE